MVNPGLKLFNPDQKSGPAGITCTKGHRSQSCIHFFPFWSWFVGL